MFTREVPKKVPHESGVRKYASLRKAGLLAIAFILQHPKVLNGRFIKGQNFYKRENQANRKKYTRCQWTEMKRADLRERRREDNEGAFGGEKKMRKLA